MKRLLYFSASIIISLSVYGQKNKNKDSNIPAFGQVEKADLEMKECDFDKKAEAMVMFEKGQLDYTSGFGISLDYHTRIKILADKGRDRADIHLRFMNWKNDEEIKDISAQVYNLDPSGNIIVTKVDKKQIFEKQINKRDAEKVFTFPDVKPGSIIEYKYTRTNIGMIDWNFQNSIPVKYSEFTFDYPYEVEIAFTPKCYLPYEEKSESSANRKTHFFSMKNVPALRDEPYILNDEDYMQKIETKTIVREVNGLRQSVIVNWLQVIRYLMEDDFF
ncbi:MAG TPA: DUF3857 domain-containing protein, partial [Chitinophagaceae bacterium]|nr:DUF3857 domain-containing protein [Chitinophagaceae bacterium]